MRWPGTTPAMLAAAVRAAARRAAAATSAHAPEQVAPTAYLSGKRTAEQRSREGRRSPSMRR